MRISRSRALLAGVFLAVNVVEGLVRLPYARTFRDESWQGRRDPVDAALLVAVGVAMAAAPAAYVAAPRRLARFDYRLTPRGRCALAVAGVTLEGLALWLFHRSHADLDRNWSPYVDLRDGQELVTEGLYGRIRHPMYASQVASGAAQACLLQNWLTGPAGLLAFGALCLRRIPREEAMLRERFGAAWDAHAARTGRILPRLRRPGRPGQEKR